MSVEADGAFICNTEDLTGDVEHLWVIISDPTAYPESVVVVNLSSCSDNRRYDSECILKAGDHWFIRHDTFVYYHEAKILTSQQLNDVDISHKTSLSPRVLERICEGAGKTDRLYNDIKKHLVEQGIIEL